MFQIKPQARQNRGDQSHIYYIQQARKSRGEKKGHCIPYAQDVATPRINTITLATDNKELKSNTKESKEAKTTHYCLSRVLAVNKSRRHTEGFSWNLAILKRQNSVWMAQLADSETLSSTIQNTAGYNPWLPSCISKYPWARCWTAKLLLMGVWHLARQHQCVNVCVNGWIWQVKYFSSLICKALYKCKSISHYDQEN